MKTSSQFVVCLKVLSRQYINLKLYQNLKLVYGIIIAKWKIGKYWTFNCSGWDLPFIWVQFCLNFRSPSIFFFCKWSPSIRILQTAYRMKLIVFLCPSNSVIFNWFLLALYTCSILSILVFSSNFTLETSCFFYWMKHIFVSYCWILCLLALSL